MAISQAPRIGMKDVVYSILDTSTDIIGGTPTYGTVYPLANSMDMSFDPASSLTSLFADDGLAFAAETVGEMKVTFSNADILPEDMARITGQTYTAGQVIDNVSNISPYLAMGFKVTMDTIVSGSPGYEYVWLYKVKLMKPGQGAKTKGASVEYQTPTLEGRVTKLTSTGNYRIRVRTDDANASATLISNFFTQVTLPSANLNAMAVAIAEGTAGNAGKIEFTFSKTGGGNFILAASTVTTSNIIVSTSDGIRAGALSAASTTPAATQVIYFTPTVAFSGSDVVGAFVTSNVKDANNVACTPNSDLITIA